MDFLQKIKSATSDIHYKIENNSFFSKIVLQEITIVEYTKLLCQLHQFISPRELYIKNQYGDLISDREKSPLLLSDLSAMGCDEIENENEPLEIRSAAEAFGYLYVIEGSTLGGQVLTQFLKKNKKLSPYVSVNYFNAYGKHTKRNWALFLNELSEKNNDLEKQNRVINSALHTFTQLFNLVKIA